MGADKRGLSDDVGGPDVSQQLVVNLVGGFGGLSRNSGAGSRCFRFMFAAIEPAYDIGTDHDVIFEVFDFLPLPFGCS
jgi:hypothetical protein